MKFSPLPLLASLLQADGRTADALHHYETVLEHDDRNVVALNNAAWLYQLGGAPRALALAERAYALQPENPAVLDTLGTCASLFIVSEMLMSETTRRLENESAQRIREMESLRGS